MQRFIVVDDSRAIQSIIRRTLAAGGYDKDSVHTVSSGSEALDLVSSLNPDLIVTDWHMPGMSGLELLQALRQSGHTRIKVGLVTTEVSESRLLEARNNGVEFILHKPFEDGELLAKVHQAVGAPASREVAPAPATAPVEAFASAEVVRKILAQTLRDAPFTLEKAEAIRLEKGTPKVLLGLYSPAGKKTVNGLCLMDITCLGLLGGSALGYKTAQIQNVIATGEISEPLFQRATAFLKDLASLFPKLADTETQLARSNVVSVELDLLKKALQNNIGLQAYTLNIPGVGQGRFALVKLQDAASK